MQKKENKFANELSGDKLTEVIDKDSNNTLGLLGVDDNKVKRYQQAKQGKRILFGEEDNNGVDWTHFDFLLSLNLPFNYGMSNLSLIHI